MDELGQNVKPGIPKLSEHFQQTLHSVGEPEEYMKAKGLLKEPKQ